MDNLNWWRQCGFCARNGQYMSVDRYIELRRLLPTADQRAAMDEGFDYWDGDKTMPKAWFVAESPGDVKREWKSRWMQYVSGIRRKQDGK